MEHASISHRQTAVEENQIGLTGATLDRRELSLLYNFTATSFRS